MKNLIAVLKGGSGSGHFGHSGRPGEQGGSLPGGGGKSGGVVQDEAQKAKDAIATARASLRVAGKSNEPKDTKAALAHTQRAIGQAQQTMDRIRAHGNPDANRHIRRAQDALNRAQQGAQRLERSHQSGGHAGGQHGDLGDMISENLGTALHRLVEAAHQVKESL